MRFVNASKRMGSDSKGDRSVRRSNSTTRRTEGCFDPVMSGSIVASSLFGSLLLLLLLFLCSLEFAGATHFSIPLRGEKNK